MRKTLGNLPRMSKQILREIKEPRETPSTTNHANRTWFCG